MLVLVAFLVAGGLIAWHYMLYPLVLTVGATVFGNNTSPAFDDDELPSISIIIIAYNEADVIVERIKNCLSVEYPIDLIEVVVASDGSTDETVQRAREVAGPVRVLQNEGGSKSDTRNEAVEVASHDIILFTDADTRYKPSCVRRIVDRYADSDVGAVCGTLVSGSFEEGAIGRGMDIYWRWEYFMREQQGRLGRLVKMSGANMSMRRSFYRDVPDMMDIDQVAGLNVIRAGGKAVHAGDAVAEEEFLTEPEGELSVRHRLTIRAFSALRYHRGIFNLIQYPFLAVHITSYWVLRYVIPFLLPALFIATLLLALQSRLAWPLVVGQVAFYALAGIGYVAPDLRDSSFVGVAFSYSWANLGVASGVISYISGARLESY